MRLARFGFALFTLLLLGTLAAAQGPFFNPYFAGGVGFQRGRVAVGVGFVRPIGPVFGPPFVGGVVYQRVNHIALIAPPVVQPPPIIIINNPPPVFDRGPERMQPPVERVLPGVPELPPLPDVPAVPDMPPVPNIPPMPREVPPPIPPQEEMPLPPPPRPKPAPKPKDRAKPAPQPDDGEPRLPQREEPAADAQEEAERLLRRGRDEFAVGEYGRAAQRFRRAGELNPRDTSTPFLVVQCLLAMAKYAEASEALVAVLKARTDWPTTAFRPLDLHTAAGDYAETIEALETTRKRHPDEPLLQFLAGYMRWLDGRREEARDLFRQARAAGFAPEAIEAFLKALPDAAPL
jgi:hypothetical protein